jgi:hypothetical protein
MGCVQESQRAGSVRAGGSDRSTLAQDTDDMRLRPSACKDRTDAVLRLHSNGTREKTPWPHRTGTARDTAEEPHSRDAISGASITRIENLGSTGQGVVERAARISWPFRVGAV